MEQNAADKAYKWAENEISKAKKMESNFLELDLKTARALNKLPPEIADLNKLTILHLGDTQVSDISLLSELKNLQHLDLANTQVVDLRPICTIDKGLTQITTLDDV